jgi:DNA-binding transcriptional ArsR family regulator
MSAVHPWEFTSAGKRLSEASSFCYFADMRNGEPKESMVKVLKALASPVRLTILDDLKNPARNFPPQVDGDPVADGICADFIRGRLGLAPATASRHLSVLAEAGLIVATRKRGWTFYRRDEEAIRRSIDRIGKVI